MAVDSVLRRIQDALETRSRHLTLMHQGLTSLPPEIGQLTNLQNLDLDNNGLTALPPEIGQLTNLQTLYLNRNGLTALPPEITQLTNLQTLYLDNNGLTALPPEIGQLTNLQTLYLDNNGLTALPPEIGQLTNLQTLYLNGNGLTALPPEITQLTNLQTLTLNNNGLTSLPPEITQLTNLQTLTLNNNGLTSLPPEITQLTNLQTLTLNRNGLTSLPPEITQLTNLQTLYLNGNGLTSLPPEITQLTNLQTLYLNGNGLTALPPEITQLTNLQTLTLDNNGLTALPPEITQLTNLQTLYLNGNGLTALPPEITQLTNLQNLTLDNNGLTALPPEITQLTNLQTLTLDNNGLTALPPEITQLTNLQTLYLNGNGLTALPPEITQLTNLQTLYLNGNGLTALPPEIGQLTNLQILDLDNNPLAVPPAEVADQGLRAIREYFEQLESQGSGQLYEAKLLIVGEPGAGKTSLAKKLIDPGAPLSAAEPTTRGIETWPWQFEYDDKTVNVTIWDFGGQDIYHSTHQFFLTSRSAYALVADVRREDTDFDYWLDVTGRLSNFSPLAIVNNEKQGKRKALDIPGLQRRHRHVEAVAETDLASNQGLEDVQATLQSLVFNLDHIGTTLPAGWVGIRGGLEELRSQDRDYLSWSEYKALCEKHEVIDRTDQLQVAGYLHDLGVCLHFADDHFLHKTIILNSTWATDAVYRVLDDDQVISDWGIFDQDDLNRIWHEDRYADMQFELLQLMLRFRLCYQLPGTTSYLTPQLLSPETPNYQLDETDRYHVQYNYEFMPRGIIHQLIVRLHHLILNGDVMWRTGVVFERDGSTAQVVEHSRSGRIDIEVTGGNTRGLTALVVDAIDRINASFENIGAQLSLPCICPECQLAGKPELFDAEKLKKLARKKPTKECGISGEDVPIEKLLDALTPVELLQRPQIYVSYKWEGQSEPIADQVVSTFADHDLQVRRDKNEVRYRDNIREFMDRLSRGDAIITIISDAYLKSENTMYELLEIYRLSEGPNDTPIFPIIMPDAQIYQAEGRASYLEYWDKRAGDLTKQAQELNNPAFGLQADLELFQNIRNAIAGIADLLKNMAGIPLDEMLATDFAVVREAVKHSARSADKARRKGDPSI